LDELELNDAILGSAILHKCQDFAHGISHLASQLEGYNQEEQQWLTQACYNDYQQQLQLTSSNSTIGSSIGELEDKFMEDGDPLSQ
jgi:hypothetical protein